MNKYYKDTLLPTRRAFHFCDTPPIDLCSTKYLKSNNPKEVLAAILAFAQEGNFNHLPAIISLMKQFDDAIIWGNCSMLLSHVAPFSVLRELIEAFSHDLFEKKDAVIQQWINEILCISGGLWTVPEVIKIFRCNKKRDKYFSTPFYLSIIIEPEREDISDGPPAIPEPGPWPEWFDSIPFTYDDDAYERLVLSHYEKLCLKVSDPLSAAVFEGEPLSLLDIARNAMSRIQLNPDSEEISIARLILEANTGVDLSAFYNSQALLHQLNATATIEDLIKNEEFERYELGTRYFWGHEIPK